MADLKRQSGGGKVPVATPNIGGTGSVTLETALSGCVGARIRIETTAPAKVTLEGTLFTVDPITNLVALNTSPPPPTPASPTSAQPGDYHIIPLTRIANFNLVSLALSNSVSTSENQANQSSFSTSTPSIHAVDLRALRVRENAAITRLQERESRRGKGVTREAQEIFDALSRTMPTRWDGASIVVSDNVVIKPPYNPQDCQALPGEGANAVVRIVKVLEMERQKIALRSSAQKMNAAGSRVAIPTTPAGGIRKGG